MTVLDRMSKKGLVDRERDGRAWRYTASSSRAELTSETLHHTLGELAGDTRRTALLHFLDESTPEEIDELRGRARRARGAVNARAPHSAPASNAPDPCSSLALVALAIVLAWPVPRLLARVTTVRRGPRAALVLWQSTAVAAVLAALFAAPAAVPWIVGSAPRLQDDWAVVAVGRRCSPASSRCACSSPATGWVATCAACAVGTASSSTCSRRRATGTPASSSTRRPRHTACPACGAASC